MQPKAACSSSSARSGKVTRSGGQRQDDRYPRQNSWFGQRERQYTPQGSAYADPGAVMQERYGPSGTPSIGGSVGRSVAYCVRLCDGRYFPMQRHSNATSIQLCNAFCPAAKTQVFNGSQIDHAVTSNGARYTDLDNAFVYREKIVTGCTCNGKDAFGLAKIDVANDPTLRPGDIVASGDNQKAALAAAPAKATYARVDIVPDDEGVLRIMELELIEPSLFLDRAPDRGEGFTNAILSFVHGQDVAAIDVNLRRVIGRIALGDGNAPMRDVEAVAAARVDAMADGAHEVSVGEG